MNLIMEKKTIQLMKIKVTNTSIYKIIFSKRRKICKYKWWIFKGNWILGTLNVFLTIVIGFIGIFSDRQKAIQHLVIFEASESLRKNKDIVLVFYAVEKGLKKIFTYNFNGIKNKKEKGRKQVDMQLSLFW